MPRYDYKCLKCESVFEINHKITEEPQILCPKDSFICKRQISKNVAFETPVDVEWTKDPAGLSASSLNKFNKAKKKKFRW